MWVDPRLREDLKRMLLLPLRHPQLWNADLCRPQSLIMVCGQPISCPKEEMLVHLFKEFQISVYELNFNQYDFEGTVANIKHFVAEIAPTLPLHVVLVIRNAHFLPVLVNHAPEFCLNLGSMGRFVVAISDSPPQAAESECWIQFQPNSVLCIDTPPKEYIKEYHRSRFDAWKLHCDQQGILLTLDMIDDDYEWLAISSDYCFEDDVDKFCTRVFQWCIEQHLKKKKNSDEIKINRGLLADENNHFMFGIPEIGAHRITNRNTIAAQQQIESKCGILRSVVDFSQKRRRRNEK